MSKREIKQKVISHLKEEIQERVGEYKTNERHHVQRIIELIHTRGAGRRNAAWTTVKVEIEEQDIVARISDGDREDVEMSPYRIGEVRFGAEFDNAERAVAEAVFAILDPIFGYDLN